ncbi:DUF488 domain-containing protein [Breznakiella homolactica]|uniref:DUF488 domain-containing protein n=1 Tax=Breznakiella homolactica TaxID=2798577 RepID=A0A7T8B8Y5_9SPIR|nr:DUF488 domain-containing protein [Breznakiella homolactica]QQO07892.1 DUF488 domain-containing protein [Breznakiella homolactica]
MVDTVYTIGYSGFSLDAFIQTITARGISLVIDVRSQPFSRYYNEYNRENLEKVLSRCRIHYRSYAAELGGKQTDRRYYTAGTYFDFERYAQSESFAAGFEKVKQSLERGYSISLMCAEKDPFNCHRAIMIARVFHEAGFKVIHLLPDNKEMTQEDIEERLLARYFPAPEQPVLFESAMNREEALILAYRKRNEDMGKRFSEEQT